MNYKIITPELLRSMDFSFSYKDHNETEGTNYEVWLKGAIDITLDHALKKVVLTIQEGYCDTERFHISDFDTLDRLFNIDQNTGEPLFPKNQSDQPIRVYIAGKVSGLQYNEVFNKFLSWQQCLEAMGFEVINPTNIVRMIHTPWDVAMRLCVAELAKCDAVYFLPCWQDSPGAIIEHSIAVNLNVPAIFGDKYIQKRIRTNAQVLTNYNNRTKL